MTKFLAQKKHASDASMVLLRLAGRRLSAILVASLLAVGPPALADQKQRIDFDSFTRVATEYVRPATLRTPQLGLEDSVSLDSDLDVGAQAPTVNLASGPVDPFLPQVAQFEDVSTGHHVRWNYDSDWSGSFSSDFPHFALPAYLVGNGAPGVPQRVYFQLSLARNFF